ncbi:unnamed protein product [Boreogadus saida]
MRETSALVLSDVVGRQKPFPAEHRDTAQKTCCHLHLSHKEGQEGFHSADQVLEVPPQSLSSDMVGPLSSDMVGPLSSDMVGPPTDRMPLASSKLFGALRNSRLSGLRRDSCTEDREPGQDSC